MTCTNRCCQNRLYVNVRLNIQDGQLWAPGLYLCMTSLAAHPGGEDIACAIVKWICMLHLSVREYHDPETEDLDDGLNHRVWTEIRLRGEDYAHAINKQTLGVRGGLQQTSEDNWRLALSYRSNGSYEIKVKAPPPLKVKILSSQN